MNEQQREALKARAYVEDILAGLVPSDPEFAEIWALIPKRIAASLAAPTEYIELADKVRAVKHAHVARFIDSFQA